MKCRRQRLDEHRRGVTQLRAHPGVSFGRPHRVELADHLSDGHRAVDDLSHVSRAFRPIGLQDRLAGEAGCDHRETPGQRAGVAQNVIDTVRTNRDTAGLPEKDALVIRYGRELFRKHKIDSALYAKVVEQFGRQGMVDLTLTLGDYAMTALLLNAVDQHLPPGRTVNLPPK